jgi:hypothetical protein
MTTLDTHHARTRRGRIWLHLRCIAGAGIDRRRARRSTTAATAAGLVLRRILRALAGILREVFLFF